MQIKSRIQDALVNIAMNHGFSLDRTVSAEAIGKLFRKIRPIPIDRELIRLGSAHDGGYLVPDDLDDIVACISPGVSTESSFDLEIAHRGIPVYMIDKTVDGPAIPHEKFHFFKKFLDTTTTDSTMTLRELCSCIPSFSDGGDLLLQMDIEGAEYRVILSVDDELLNRMRIIVLEIHDLHRFFGRTAFEYLTKFFEKICKTHKIVHVHANNFRSSFRIENIEIPRELEMTFYRLDRANFFESNHAQIPHPLDTDNASHLRPVSLPIELFQQKG